MSNASIVERPISPDSLIRAVSGSGKGAVCVFLGTVRDINDGRPVAGLSYSAYREMALAEMEKIVEEVAEQFGVTDIVIEHRVGALEIGDVSVGIAGAHAHRAPAMAATSYAIEELKRRVPIWKEEHYTDGTKDWVDPTAASAAR